MQVAGTAEDTYETKSDASATELASVALGAKQLAGSKLNTGRMHLAFILEA